MRKRHFGVGTGVLMSAILLAGCGNALPTGSPQPPATSSTQNSTKSKSPSATSSTSASAITMTSKSSQSGNASAFNTTSKGNQQYYYDTTPTVHGVPQISSVPQGEVALTIDDGPSPYTEQIISVLNQYHAKATFFFIGENVLRYPDAVRMAAASGDEIGDHTVHHPQLTHLSAERQAEEINQAVTEIEMYDPEPVQLFRPPYEAFNRTTDKILAEDKLALALWNRDPKDWAAKTPEQIVQAVLAGDPSGGVFDLHDKLLTLEALPAILQGLQERHLQLVVLPVPTASGVSMSGQAIQNTGTNSGS